MLGLLGQVSKLRGGSYKLRKDKNFPYIKNKFLPFVLMNSLTELFKCTQTQTCQVSRYPFKCSDVLVLLRIMFAEEIVENSQNCPRFLYCLFLRIMFAEEAKKFGRPLILEMILESADE